MAYNIMIFAVDVTGYTNSLCCNEKNDVTVAYRLAALSRARVSTSALSVFLGSLVVPDLPQSIRSLQVAVYWSDLAHRRRAR